MSQIGEAVIRIRPDVSGFKQAASKQIDGAVKQTGAKASAALGQAGTKGGAAFAAGAAGGARRTQSTYLGAAKAIGAGFAGLAVVRFLRDSVKEAVAADVQMKRATASFERLGIGAKATGEAFEEVGKRAIRMGFDDEKAVDSLGLLTRISGDVTKGMSGVAAAMDIARARGIPLETATRAVANAQLGNTRALKQLGIALKPVTTAQDQLKTTVAALREQQHALTKESKGASDSRKKEIDETKEQIRQQILRLQATAADAKAADKAATATEALRLIHEKLGNQAETFAQTSGGRLATLSERFNNLQEDIGKGLLPVVVTVGEALGRSFTSASADARSFAEAIRPVSGIVAGLVGQFRNLAGGLGTGGILATAASFLLVSRSAGSAAAAVRTLGAVFGALRAVAAAQGVMAAFSVGVRAAGASLASAFGPQLLAIGAAGIVASIFLIRSSMSTLRDEAAQAASAIQGVFDARVGQKSAALAVQRAKLERDVAIASSGSAAVRLANERTILAALVRRGATEGQVAGQTRKVTVAEREAAAAALRAAEANNRLEQANQRLRAEKGNVKKASTDLAREFGGLATKAGETARKYQEMRARSGDATKAMVSGKDAATVYARALVANAKGSDTLSKASVTTATRIAALVRDLGHVPTKQETKVIVDVLAAGGNVEQIRKKLGIVHKAKTKPKIDADPSGVFAVAAKVIDKKRQLAQPVSFTVNAVVGGGFAAAANAFRNLIELRAQASKPATASVGKLGFDVTLENQRSVVAELQELVEKAFKGLKPSNVAGIVNSVKTAVQTAVREARSSLNSVASSVADTAGRIIDAVTQKAIKALGQITDNPSIAAIEAGLGARSAARSERDARRSIDSARRGVSDADAALATARLAVPGAGDATKTPQERADAARAVADAQRAADDARLALQDAEENLTDFLAQQEATRLRAADDARKADLAAQIQDIQDKAQLHKDELARRIADETAAFNEGAQTFQQYLADLQTILGEEGATFGAAGELLGGAFADSFKAQLDDLIRIVEQIVRAGDIVKGDPLGGFGSGPPPSTAQDALDKLGVAQGRRADLKTERGEAKRQANNDLARLNAAKDAVTAAGKTKDKEDDKAAKTALAEATKTSKESAAAVARLDRQIVQANSVIALLQGILKRLGVDTIDPGVLAALGGAR